MPNLADEAAQLMQLEQQQRGGLSVAHNFILIYEDQHGAVVSVGPFPSRISECYNWLEEQGVDLLHGSYAFGTKSEDGSTTTKWQHPQMLTMLGALIAHPIP